MATAAAATATATTTTVLGESAVTATTSTGNESSTTQGSSARKCYEVKLTNYGWDQSSSTVKLYVTLKNVHQLPKEAVTCNFTEKSVDLRVLGLENKNYNLPISNLCEEIVPEKSCVKTKTDMVVISMKKAVAKDWSHITGIEKRIKGAKLSIPDVTEDTDPSTNMINIMKKMYQEGGDDVKRIITKAWTESQEKKATGLSDY